MHSAAANQRIVMQRRLAGYNALFLPRRARASAPTGAGKHPTVTLFRCRHQDWVGVERRARPGCGDDATHGCGVVRPVVRDSSYSAQESKVTHGL